MRSNGNRVIKLLKTNLITTIKENKAKHIKMYDKAVIAYKKEAMKQLSELSDEVEKGKLGITLNLVTPINNAENYDKILEMFEWEIEEKVELTQSEFKEYVQDETSQSEYAMVSNMTYL